MRVLVTYASRHGATKGIAERIAQTLDRTGLEVTLLPVEDAEPIAEYDAFVIGSGAYLGGWRAGLLRCLRPGRGGGRRGGGADGAVHALGSRSQERPAVG